MFVKDKGNDVQEIEKETKKKMHINVETQNWKKSLIEEKIFHYIEN